MQIPHQNKTMPTEYMPIYPQNQLTSPSYTHYATPLGYPQILPEKTPKFQKLNKKMERELRQQAQIIDSLKSYHKLKPSTFIMNYRPSGSNGSAAYEGRSGAREDGWDRRAAVR